jgi:hypothetical protein
MAQLLAAAQKDITLKKAVDGAVGDSPSAGTGPRVLANQYGVRQFTGSQS